VENVLQGHNGRRELLRCIPAGYGTACAPEHTGGHRCADDLGIPSPYAEKRKEMMMETQVVIRRNTLAALRKIH